jgi:hypothetical protein
MRARLPPIRILGDAFVEATDDPAEAEHEGERRFAIQCAVKAMACCFDFCHLLRSDHENSSGPRRSALDRAVGLAAVCGRFAYLLLTSRHVFSFAREGLRPSRTSPGRSRGLLVGISGGLCGLVEQLFQRRVGAAQPGDHHSAPFHVGQPPFCRPFGRRA